MPDRDVSVNQGAQPFAETLRVENVMAHLVEENEVQDEATQRLGLPHAPPAVADLLKAHPKADLDGQIPLQVAAADVRRLFVTQGK